MTMFLADRFGKARKYLREKEGKSGVKAWTETLYEVIGLEEFTKLGDGADLKGKPLASKKVVQMKGDAAME